MLSQAQAGHFSSRFARVAHSKCQVRFWRHLSSSKDLGTSDDDWSKPCCMSNTMPPVQKYCHSYRDIPVLSSGKNERRHKKNWSATDCLPSIQYFHHEPSSCKAGFLWLPRNSAGGGPRWFLAWRNGRLTQLAPFHKARCDPHIHKHQNWPV